jgi:alanyl-tRNA synthetase
MKNHTATHILNLALRKVLGDHIDQKGSLVDAEKTRFDFSHDKALTSDEIQQIEEIANNLIQEDLPVSAKIMPLAEAKKIPGVRAVFGEKYPDPVRVVTIGDETSDSADRSVEFCGGTHLSRSSQAGLFKIISQEPVSKGVRRVTAVTGRKAVEYVRQLSSVLDDLTGKFNCRAEELPTRMESLQEELKKLQKQLQKGVSADLNTVGDQLLSSAIQVKDSKLIVGEVPSVPVDALKSQVDRLKTKAGSAIVIIGWKGEEGNGIIVGVTDDLIKKGIKSGEVIKPIAEAAGGKGGGPPTMAQAGIKDGSRIAEALKKALELGKEQLQR